ncbi:MAG: hypothetical protein ACLTEE_00940 [Anaerobutyricum hallii]
MLFSAALQRRIVHNKVVPIDKSSAILTILLALIFLHEGLTLEKAGCVCLIGVGTALMITRKEVTEDREQHTLGSWIYLCCIICDVCSLTTILGKIRYF